MKITKESLRDKYITIQGWMIVDLGLSGNDLIIYALIYGFSQDGKSVFSGSLKYISAFSGISKQSVVKVIARLINAGLVEKKDRGSEDGNTYRALMGSKESLHSKESLPGQESLPGVVTKVDTPYSIISIDDDGGSITDTITDKKKLSNDSKEIMSSVSFKDSWNSIVVNCSKVTVLSEPRRKKVLSRIKEMAEIGDANEVLTICLNKINNSLFCNGNNDRGWKATFDWFIDNGNNWVKVYEGKYDNRGETEQPKEKYPDGTYWESSFKDRKEIVDLFRFEPELRKHVLSGFSIKRKDGRWFIC